MISKRIRKIKHSRLKSCLKTLSKIERGQIPFSKNIMSKMSPWNMDMCDFLGVDFPPDYNQIAAKPVIEIVKSYGFSKIFLDNLE